MKRFLLPLFILLVVLGGAFAYVLLRPKPPLETKFIQPERVEVGAVTGSAGFEEISSNERSDIAVKQPGNEYLLSSPRHVYQTFNNCGPATLSMMLGWYGVDVSQAELGKKMRPYQNPEGDNDDKTIFTYEFAWWAEKYGLSAVSRVNGTIEILKLFVVNEIPVVVKTWLNPNDDIGHFRLVRGFDEAKQVIIQDDSYHGPNKRISYYDFLSMWQPFNYDYIIVYPQEKEELVNAILAGEGDEQIAWSTALERAKREEALDPTSVYPVFNQVTSHYHLREYAEAVVAFERVESRLPRRMLWYQIEPIQAYQKLGRADRVFAISDALLNGGNRAFSELYLIRGEIYLEQGDTARAREEFELALQYNEHYDAAREALAALSN